MRTTLATASGITTMVSVNLDAFRRAGLVNALRTCRLFTDLSAENLANLAELTTVRPLRKGEYLFHEGDPAPGFYVVQTGAINLHRVNAAGREQVIHVFRAGDSFAEGTLVSDKGYPADARAVEPSQVLLIQKAGLLLLLKRHPELTLRVLASMNAHLQDLMGQLDDLQSKDVDTRLASWLVKRCGDPGSDKPAKIELPMTKRLLAAELGTVSETFSRALARFRQRRLIEVQGRNVIVLCPLRLAALLRKEPGELRLACHAA